VRLCAEEGAYAHVTTQAPTIIHSTDHGGSSQEALLTALPGAFLEYLPDPVILFPEAHFSSALRLRAHPGGTIVVSDSFLTHDPGALGSIFDTYLGEVVVERGDGELLARDRFRLAGKEFVARFPGVSARYAGQGTVLVVGKYDAEAMANDLRAALADLNALTSELQFGALSEAEYELLNMLTLGTQIAKCALLREESRGGHLRDDFPAVDDEHWRRHVTLRLPPHEREEGVIGKVEHP